MTTDKEKYIEAAKIMGNLNDEHLRVSRFTQALKHIEQKTRQDTIDKLHKEANKWENELEAEAKEVVATLEVLVRKALSLKAIRRAFKTKTEKEVNKDV